MKLLPLRNLRLVMTETLKKTDDDHDSGTESDDESAEIEELQKYMEQSIQLEDSSGGHSASRLCQHASFRQPESRQQNKSADRRRLLPQQHHHHHAELLSSPAVVLVTAHHVVGPNVAPNSSPVLLDSALPSDSDPNLEQHSSEEELEVINNRAGSAEKRKWSQANQRRGARASLRRSRSDGGGDTSSDDEECDAASGATLADGVSSRATANGVGRRNDVEDDDEDDDEDDEEVRDLTWSGRVGGAVGVGVMNGLHGSAASAASSARSSSQRSSSSTAVVPPTPVEFRASPPLHVHRPYNGSPPPKVFHAAPGAVGGSTSSATSSSSGPTTLTLSAHIPAFEVCAVSPRKRHRQDRGGGGTAFGVFSLVDGGPVQRPCLDFEKMQQIRVKLL
ncbi:regulator of eph expression isoform X2 [Rhipicephalus microplus]|uniref:regulator of eph expression isoform X2 n=1 Tax=Rhipicephalus microplus TaxID=6941 RepID=UPI003F6A81F2